MNQQNTVYLVNSHTSCVENLYQMLSMNVYVKCMVYIYIMLTPYNNSLALYQCAMLYYQNVLIRDKIELQKEQRLCVICQEVDKSVVLLPCRHLCLCSSCSSHEDLKLCPLCREVIAHKISVFAQTSSSPTTTASPP